MLSSIHTTLNNKYTATGALYLAGLALIAGDIIPTPADAAYFHIERKLRNKWQDGTITPEKYWAGEAAAYYLLNPLWWGLVLAAMVLVKGDVAQKAKVGIAVVGAGAVVGVLLKNVKKDRQQLSEALPPKPVSV